jgi:preprotein translocase subunit SecD
MHINLGLDLQGGSHLVLEAQDTPDIKVTSDRVDSALEVIRRRIDQLGVTEPTLYRQGPRRIIVELPGIRDPQRAIDLIGKTALLEFVDTGLTALPRGARWDADGKTVRMPQSEPPVQLPKKVILTGADLVDARTDFDSSTGQPVVTFSFRGKAVQTFGNFTANNIGKHLTIVLDNDVISSPVIQTAIPSGRGQISGGFTVDSARDLAVLLRAGALPVPVQLVENRTIGPELGRDSIDKSVHAGFVAIVAVVLFMALYYGVAGILADVAMGIYLLFVMGILVAFHATLTLPGIAGLILSLGIALDANVIIYEKVKEELRAGKTVGSAIQTGWNRAILTIVDSNVTTVIGAAVLFALGTGPIRGFALTLIFGVGASLFTGILVTRMLVDAGISVGLEHAIARLGMGRRSAVAGA